MLAMVVWGRGVLTTGAQALDLSRHHRDSGLRTRFRAVYVTVSRLGRG